MHNCYYFIISLIIIGGGLSSLGGGFRKDRATVHLFQMDEDKIEAMLEAAGGDEEGDGSEASIIKLKPADMKKLKPLLRLL